MLRSRFVRVRGCGHWRSKCAICAICRRIRRKQFARRHRPGPKPNALSASDIDSAIASAGEGNRTLARKKLLEILEQERKFYKIMGKGSRMKEAEALSAYRRINSQWEAYLLENPDDIEARILFGKFLRKTGNISDAYAQFCIADSKNPNIAVVKHQMAVFEAETGMAKEAYAHMLDALKLQPDNALYMSQMAKLLTLGRGTLQEHLGLDNAAYDAKLLSYYSAAAGKLPNDYRIQADYALAFYDLSKADWSAALAQWEKVGKLAALNVDRQVVLANKARVLIELNRDAEAEALLEGVTLPALSDAKNKLLGEIKRARENAALPKKKSYQY